MKKTTAPMGGAAAGDANPTIPPAPLLPTDPPFQVMPALDAATESALRSSIQRFGVLVPVTHDQHGRILDGHHRSRIADELKVKYRIDVVRCADDAERHEIARTLNADRRHLSIQQRHEMVADLRREGHSLRAIAGAVGASKDTVARDLATVSRETVPERVTGRDGKSRPATRPLIVATKNTREAERAQAALTSMPERTGVMDVKRAERVAREHQAEQRRAERIEPVTQAATALLCEIRHGDFRQVLGDLAGQVDAIITDPPYPRQFWEPHGEHNVYEDLGMLAAKLLKPDGVLAVMTGTRLEMLDNVDAQIGRHVRRRHRAIYLVPVQRWRDQIERVATGYKPILIFAQPHASDLRWINDDVFHSGEPERDTRFHHWGQSETGFAALVSRLSEPGALVVDPFLGGGTTAVVCADLGRRFVGCDVDAAAVATARERLESVA